MLAESEDSTSARPARTAAPARKETFVHLRDGLNLAGSCIETQFWTTKTTGRGPVPFSFNAGARTGGGWGEWHGVSPSWRSDAKERNQPIHYFRVGSRDLLGSSVPARIGVALSSPGGLSATSSLGLKSTILQKESIKQSPGFVCRGWGNVKLALGGGSMEVCVRACVCVCVSVSVSK